MGAWQPLQALSDSAQASAHTAPARSRRLSPPPVPWRQSRPSAGRPGAHALPDTRSSWFACNAASASCGVPKPHAEVTGSCPSRRTRSAIGPMNAGPHGMLVSGMVETDTHAQQVKAASLEAARQFDRLFQGLLVAAIVFQHTKARGQRQVLWPASRTAARVSSRKRLRLS